MVLLLAGCTREDSAGPGTEPSSQLISQSQALELVRAEAKVRGIDLSDYRLSSTGDEVLLRDRGEYAFLFRCKPVGAKCNVFAVVNQKSREVRMDIRR
jgi:hypothetical protein